MNFTRAELSYKQQFDTITSESLVKIGNCINECSNRGVLISSQFETVFLKLLKETTENLMEINLQEYIADYVNANKNPNNPEARKFIESIQQKELQNICEHFLVPSISQKCIERIHERLKVIINNSIEKIAIKIPDRVLLEVLSAEQVIKEKKGNWRRKSFVTIVLGVIGSLIAAYIYDIWK